MFRDSRPIALRKLMPFSNRHDANRKKRTSDSIHSDEDPLLDEEAAVRKSFIYLIIVKRERETNESV